MYSGFVYDTMALLIDKEVWKALRDAQDPEPKINFDKPRIYFLKAVDLL
jgi:hypothetical protein